MLLLIFTLFNSFNAVKIYVNPNDKKSFYDLTDTKTNTKLNFKNEGYWVFVYQNDEYNTDGRIYEYHTNTSVFLNFKEYLKITGEFFFNKRNRVLIFYKDKKPIMGSSIMNKTPYQYSSVYEIINSMENKIENTPDILDYVNYFPFMKLSRDYKSNVHLLWDLPGSLKTTVDNDDPNQFKFEHTDEEFGKFLKCLLDVTFDLQMTKSDLILKDSNYKINMSEELAEFADLKEQYNNEIYPEQVNNEYIIARAKNIFMAIEYYAHKLIRNYFFTNTNEFMRNLFEGYELNVSTMTKLFNENIIKNRASQIFNLKRFSEIELDEKFDVKSNGLLTNPDELNNPNKVELYFQKRIQFIDKNYKDFLSAVFQGIFKISAQYNKAYKDLKNCSFLKTFVAIYRAIRFNELYKEYLPMILSGLLNLNVAKENGLKDLDNPVKLAEFRRRLVILGYLKFDEEIDTEFIFWENYNIFEQQRRRILV